MLVSAGRRRAGLSDQADHPDRALAGRRIDRHRDARDRRQRLEASRPADRDRQQGRAAAARVGPGHHGGRRQARRLHHRADADHRVPPAADAGSRPGIRPRISPTSSTSPATPSASPPSADSQFKTWKDVVEYAKANPGKVTYATPGTGTSLHIGMEQIAAMAGIKLTQVPFKGGARDQRRRARPAHHAAGGLDRMEAAGRRRQAAPADGVDRRALAELSGRADAEGARLSLRVSTRRSASAGPKGMDPKIVAEAARRLQEGDRGPGRDRDACQIRHGAELQDTEDYQKFVVEITDSERR